MLREGIGLLLEFWYILLPVFSSWETFIPECFVEVFNVGLLVLFVRATVAVHGTTGFDRLHKDTLEHEFRT